MGRNRRSFFGREPHGPAKKTTPLAGGEPGNDLETSSELALVEAVILKAERLATAQYGALVDEYFSSAPDAPRLLDLRTSNRLEEAETTNTRLGGFTRKKLGPSTRFNEDHFRLGQDWYMVSDGIGGGGKGKAGLVGEAVAIAASEVITALQALPEQPVPVRVIRRAMKHIPIIAGKVREAFQAHPNLVSGREDLPKASDLATTAEVVYYDQQQETAFIIHVGDSRTYAIDPSGQATLLTEDHEEPQFGWLTSVVALDKATAYLQYIERKMQPGDRLLSMSDGVFNAYERTYPKEKFQAELSSFGALPLPALMDELHDFGSFNQQHMRYPDDLTAAGLERK